MIGFEGSDSPRGKEKEQGQKASRSLRALGRSFLRSRFLKIEDVGSHDPGGLSTNHRASLGPVASVLVEGLSLLGNMESIRLSVADLMDLTTEGMADLLSKGLIDTHGLFHGLLGLFLVRQPLPSHQSSDGHDGSHEGAARLSVTGDSAGEGTARSKDVLIDHTDLFLQSRKNGLSSAMIGHLVMEGRVVDLLEQFLFAFHLFLQSDKVRR